jgi:hypothetical protein
MLSQFSTLIMHKPRPDPSSRFDALTLGLPQPNRNFVPTPPSSNRSSLEESQGLPDRSRVTHTPTQAISDMKADVSPGHFTPPTPPSSPGQETSDSILKSFQNVGSRVVSSVVLENVSTATYEAAVAKATENGDWQDIR